MRNKTVQNISLWSDESFTAMEKAIFRVINSVDQYFRATYFPVVTLINISAFGILVYLHPLVSN